MKKTTIAIVLAVVMLLGMSPMAAATDTGEKYADIGGTWFGKAAAEHGYADIFSDGSGNFNPYREITRMEYAQILHRALGININYFAPTDISEHFTDVENSDEGAGELYDLVTAGIVEAGGCFEPENPITREDMILLALKALDYETGGHYAVILIMPPAFIDDSDIDESIKWDIYKAVVLRLINGYEDYSLRPKAAANRAQAVTVVSRLTALIEGLTQRVDVSASMYEEDGGLKMTLTIENRTDNTITIHHTSGQRFDFKLFDDKGETLYTWSEGKMFTMALGTTEIEPGESVYYEVLLESELYEGVKDSIASMKAYIAGTSEDFFVDAEGYEA